MSSTNFLWPLVHTERAALINDLDGVDDQAWARPSLCQGWTVADVAAHLIDNARTTRTGFMVGLLRARFDFDRANAAGVQREGGRTPDQMLRRLREVAPRTSTPPASLDSRLVEEIVHGEDIRRPLGITRSYPTEALARAIQVQAATRQPPSAGPRSSPPRSACRPPTHPSPSARGRSSPAPRSHCSSPSADGAQRWTSSTDQA